MAALLGGGRPAAMAAAAVAVDQHGTDRLVSSRLVSIQVLRALAALAVAAAHIQAQLTQRYGFAWPGPDLSIGVAGVDLFFVISGFIMVYASQPLFGRPGGPSMFLKHRLARIVPLYWIVTTVVTSYILIRYRDLAAANISTAWMTASYLFLPWRGPDGTMTPVVAVGWTLNYEMLFYGIFALAVSRPRRAAVAIATGALLALAAVGQIAAVTGVAAFWTNPVVIEFAFGMLIALAYREGVRLPRTLGGVLVAAALAGFCATAFNPQLPFRTLEWGLPAAAVVAGVTLAASPPATAPGWRALARLGDASYALYLTHDLVIIMPRLLMSRWIDRSASPWVYAVPLMLAAIAAALFVHRWVERPLARTLRNRGLPHPGDEPAGHRSAGD